MKSFLGIITAFALMTPVYAQKVKPVKSADIGDFPFWATKKQPNTKPFIPGLNAVLQLSTEQVEKVAKAKDDVMNSDDVKAAIKAGKGDPNARTKLEAAQTKLYKQVEAILTAKQKELIEKINAAYTEAMTGALEAKQADFAAAKGNKEEMAKLRVVTEEKAISDFNGKLDSILTKEQKAALEEAKKRVADSPKKVKPAK